MVEMGRKCVLPMKSNHQQGLQNHQEEYPTSKHSLVVNMVVRNGERGSQLQTRHHEQLNFVKVGKRQMSVYERISMFENQTILLEQKEQKTECITSAWNWWGEKETFGGVHILSCKEKEGSGSGWCQAHKFTTHTSLGQTRTDTNCEQDPLELELICPNRKWNFWMDCFVVYHYVGYVL